MAVLLPIYGAALGVGCGLLFLHAKRRESMAWGLGAIIVSFLLMSAGILAVRMIAPDALIPSGALSVLAFLVTAVIALLHERDATP